MHLTEFRFRDELPVFYASYGKKYNPVFNMMNTSSPQLPMVYRKKNFFPGWENRYRAGQFTFVDKRPSPPAPVAGADPAAKSRVILGILSFESVPVPLRIRCEVEVLMAVFRQEDQMTMLGAGGMRHAVVPAFDALDKPSPVFRLPRRTGSHALAGRPQHGQEIRGLHPPPRSRLMQAVSLPIASFASKLYVRGFPAGKNVRNLESCVLSGIL